MGVGPAEQSTEGRKRVKDALENLDQTQDLARALLRRWSAVADPIAARTDILKMRPGEFTEEYLAGGTAGNGSFIREFWAQLGRTGLELLTSEYEKQVGGRMARIKELYGK